LIETIEVFSLQVVLVHFYDTEFPNWHLNTQNIQLE